MRYYALVDNSTNKVLNISVADEGWDSTGWIECTNKQCGIGYSYNSVNNVFIAPQPYPSWSLDENLDWQPPTSMPTEGRWYWDENTTSWVEVIE